MSGYKKNSITHQQNSLGGVLQIFIHQFVDPILCTLSPHYNVHRENGVYQQWATYALKSKSVPRMHFLAIWRSKFADLATVKKLNLWEKTAVDRSAWIKAWRYNGKIIYFLLKFAFKRAY